MQDEKETPAPTRGVPVQLDKERRIRITFATRRKIINEGLIDGKGDISMTGDTVMKVLWYGLLHEDPELTIEQVEEMVDLENFMTVVTALAKALGYKGKPIVDTGEGRVQMDPTPAAATDAPTT